MRGEQGLPAVVVLLPAFVVFARDADDGERAVVNGSAPRPSGVYPVTSEFGTGAVPADAIALCRARFRSGAPVAGVRADILRSWERCRDVHRLREPRAWARSPARSPAPTPPRVTADPRVEIALSAARSLDERLELPGGLVVVATGRGRVVGVLGEPAALALARRHGLMAGANWSERAMGTNAIGTALVCGSVRVTGPEHWWPGLDDWTAAGEAVHDDVAGAPCAVLAVVAVPCPRCRLPERAVDWLRLTAREVHIELRDAAAETVLDLLAAFADQQARGGEVFAVADSAGRVLAAGEQAGPALGRTRPKGAPTTLRPRVLAGLVRLVGDVAGEDAVTLRPVRREGQLIGMLIGRTDSTPARSRTGGEAPFARLAGLHGSHILLLSPAEIRMAHADGNTVWLYTDRGRLRCPERGLGHLEARLAGHGFLRVRRDYLVNLRRVAEVAPTFHGGLMLILAGTDRETVPVSRRRIPSVRDALGL